MLMPLELPFDGAECHCVGTRRNVASRLPAPDVTPLFRSETPPSHSETSVADRHAARETAQTTREDHFALPKGAEEDGGEPQANRNPGGDKFDAGVHRRDYR